MDSYTDSFNQHSDSLRDRHEAEDFDNLQHTLSGVETGQQTRHGLGKDTDGSDLGSKRRSVAERIRETLDWLLLNDPIYKRAYDDTWSVLNEAETATENALGNALLTLEDAQANLDRILKRAAQLPDGTRVFRDANGDAWTENGIKLDTATSSAIQWTGSEATYEEFLADRNRVRDAQAIVDDLRGIQVELGGYRNELTDQDDPPSKDRLGTIRGRAQKIKANISDQAPDNNTSQSNEADYSDTLSPESLSKKPIIDFDGKP